RTWVWRSWYTLKTLAERGWSGVPPDGSDPDHGANGQDDQDDEPADESAPGGDSVRPIVERRGDGLQPFRHDPPPDQGIPPDPLFGTRPRPPTFGRDTSKTPGAIRRSLASVRWAIAPAVVSPAAMRAPVRP